MTAEAKEATEQQAATYVLSLVRATIRRDHQFIDELLAVADPASTCRALLGFVAMRMINGRGADAAVEELDRLIRKVANGATANEGKEVPK